jgi:nucleoside-diphosphate-sugar epimerase
LKSVMITGVYGLIAGSVYRQLVEEPDRYTVYGLARRRVESDRVPDDETISVPEGLFILSDLSDLDEVTEAVSGMDAVVHMAADPSGGGGWESVLNSNVIGAYNIFEGCRRAGVKRVVFASSIQVSASYRGEDPYVGYREGVKTEVTRITHRDPVRPMNLYASSKVWGEALARVYADVHGLSCLCIRIGWVVGADRPPRADASDIWCSRRDIVQLA